MPPIEARKSSPSTFSGRPPGPGPEVGPILRILGQALTNILNHPNFGMPGALITAGPAGIVQSVQSLEAAGARTGRFGARLDW